MYTTIFFDLGNVVLEIFPEKMCANLGTLTGLGQERIQQLFFKEKLLDLYESGKVTTNELCQHLSHLSNRNLEIAELKHHMSHENSYPREELVSLLVELKKKDIELIALSNTNEIHFHFNRDYFNFIHHFDELVLSYEVGVLKPDPKIYAHALKRASSSPEKCLFIDDLKENIEGAQRAGINGHHFTGFQPLYDVLKVHRCL
ncbi:MAG: HAD family phosphatase [Candidatus Algichlamydia australiensis]|nr:HAD family phosphatase [Chlamydiales bacterium]